MAPHNIIARVDVNIVVKLSETILKRFGRCAKALSLTVAVLAAPLLMPSCSPKKNTAASRNYQAFITRYNVYFNGDQHYKETLKEMETAYQDDYSGPLLMHPAEAIAVPSAPQPSGSFTRSIEKAQKAIQLHSIKKRPARKSGHANDPEYKAWMKREEYNPFLHNAWMMMGRAQYMNGDFSGAASTFSYVAKHFTWLPATVTEARLWEARSYCAMDWMWEAETILTRTKEDALTSRSLRELWNFTWGDFLVRSHDYARAIPYLRAAAEMASGAQKSRLYFILGRVCAMAGEGEQAYEAYGKAASGAASQRTRFNARIKQSEVYAGADITPEVKALRRLARYGSNSEYLDQIYYAIGNLYLSRGDTLNAIENYNLAIKKSTRDGLDKAIAQTALGDLEFARGRYDLAQTAYSEALPRLPETWPGLEEKRRRSDVLDELAVYTRNVVLNDSLLRLADMPEEQRLKIIDNIIEALKKKEKEEAEEAAREEYLAARQGEGSGLNTQGVKAPQEFRLNTDDSWYFYNEAARNAGRTEFQRRWGSRRLEDDWRRRNKASYSFISDDEDTDGDDSDDGDNDETAGNDGSSSADGDNAPGASSKEDAETARHAADPHFPEYYIKQIPVTDLQKTTARDIIQEGLYNSGLILKDRLEDYPSADRQWDRLMGEFPENVYRLDVYHNRYLMYMRQGREDLAEPYRQLILTEFPDTRLAQAMTDPTYLAKLRAMPAEVEKLYEDTYEAYLANDNERVHRAYTLAAADYPLSPLLPKFMFLHALAYVTQEQPEEFRKVIEELLELYPDADVTPLAAAWHKGLTEGRELHSPVGGNTRSPIWDIRLTNDSTLLASGQAGPIEFSVPEPEEPHYLVLLFEADRVSPNRLLYEVARHNFTSYTVKDFDLEVMNFGPLGLLIIKGFDNQAQLNLYRSLLARDAAVSLPVEVRPVEITKSNFDRMLTGGGTFDDYFRFMGEEEIRATHESVLPPDEYEGPESLLLLDPSNPDRDTDNESSAPDTSADTPDNTSVGTDAPAKTAEPVSPPIRQNDPLYPLGSEGDEDD